MSQVIRLATRKSPLALRQAELTREHILAIQPDVEVTFVEVSTTGDEQANWSLEKEGGTGLFTAEVERVVSSGDADIGVHSAKDMPSAETPGLPIIGYLKRADVRDVLVKRKDLEGAPAFIATGSPRRRAQGKKMYPTAVWCEMRGRVETRLKKVVHGKADATFLAAAGLNRLGITEWEGLSFEPLSIEQMLPAAGQGAIALQVREGEYADLAKTLDVETGRSLQIERRFLSGLGVGCHSAFAVHHVDDTIWLYHEDLGDMRKYELSGDDLSEVDKIVEIIKTDLKALS